MTVHRNDSLSNDSLSNRQFIEMTIHWIDSLSNRHVIEFDQTKM